MSTERLHGATTRVCNCADGKPNLTCTMEAIHSVSICKLHSAINVPIVLTANPSQVLYILQLIRAGLTLPFQVLVSYTNIHQAPATVPASMMIVSAIEPALSLKVVSPLFIVMLGSSIPAMG